ncbi:uncharacterized protein LOC121506177 isoform X3 [Cheilinus undulatus]|uniref:uncharacterized protein LOC121506177 isoform X3 n=1 Tax=Cheilinus undulatus TaxID=241271 RepID=UPI001BD6604C|nr:uncharacterized protein LOC121506177 isoform X3 [Cheilinus undulatus]
MLVHLLKKKMSHPLKMLGLFFIFLSCFSTTPSRAEGVYKAVGEDVVLSLPLVESSIQSIEWKHNGDIAAEMYGNKVQYFLQFKGRCEVNIDTGALTIKGLKLNDSGIYTPEINYKVFNKTELSVISRVAKPSVIKSCNMKMTNCSLTCEGNTADAEPTTYKWFLDDHEGPPGKVLTILKDRLETSFRCMLMNPVSNETSEHFRNPFIIHAVLVYGAKDEDMILRPPPMTDIIKGIEWKHNGNIAAGWYGDKFECLNQFEGRCEVNTETGALTIKELKLTDNGIYTPEINSKVYNKIELSVISRVAKPSVVKFCNTEMTRCSLTCEGNTADTEPITYKWLLDDVDGPSDKVLTITEDTKEYSFRCLMMNPVINETSESVTNPIIIKQERNRLALIIGLVVGAIVLVVIVVAVFFIREKRRKSKKQIIELTERDEEGEEEERGPLNQPPDCEGQPKDNQHLSNGAETESVTPETSNQSLAEAAASDTDQETVL